MKKIILISIFYFLASVFLAQSAGLVPCGGLSDQRACTYCDLLQLVKNVIDFLVYLIFPIAAIMIIWGGIVVMTAGDSSERAGEGKKIITAAVVGILIALLSWLILDTIIQVTAPNFKVSNLGRPWQELKCQ